MAVAGAAAASPASATPARTASRSRCRPARPLASPAAARRAGGRARRPGCPRLAAPGGRACRCTATTSTRPRPRSRPASPGRSASAAARQGGFAGAAVILRQLADGPPRRLVGLRPEGRAPAREGTEIQAPDGTPLGRVTSGGFGPTVGGPVAMGYVAADQRGARHRARRSSSAASPCRRGSSPLPFVPHRYHR